MSVEDVLASATRALREECDGHADDACRARGAILVRTAARRRRRHTVSMASIACASLLALSTAWAAASGRLPSLTQTVSRGLELVATHSTSRGTKRVGPKSPAPPPTDPAPRAADVPIAEATPIAAPVPMTTPFDSLPHADLAPRVDAQGASVQARVAAESTPAVPSYSRDTLLLDDRYRAAHRAHFEHGDSAAALVAWDAYLRESPDGIFAREAAYNRAICLIRLRRYAEARRALDPFASGEFGEYRRQSATQLLEVLSVDR